MPAGVAIAAVAGLAVLAASVLARLVSLDVAVVVGPAAAAFAVALVTGRAAGRLARRQRRLARRLRATDRRWRTTVRAERGHLDRLVARETHEVFRQLAALDAIRDILDGRSPLPPTRRWAASPDILRELVGLILERRPRVVVELGSGASTLIIATALARVGEGHLWSVEHLPDFAADTRDRLARQGLDRWVTVVAAPLVEQPFGDGTWRWYDLSALAPDGPIEVLFVDGPPADTGPLARYPALPALLPRLAPGAAVLVDDLVRPDEQAMLARWTAEVPGLRVRPLSLEKGGSLLTVDRPDPPAP
jgi:predicted O-methyltransferase YrrM